MSHRTGTKLLLVITLVMQNIFKSLNRGVIRLVLAIVAAASISPAIHAQRMALKTNALDYLILSPNIAVEATLSRVVSLQVGVSGNPFTGKIADCRLTNFRFEPELRYWFNRPMARHFIALSLTAASYSLQFNDRMFKGDAFAGGVSYGYALVLSKRWNMEVEVGIGLANVKCYDYREGELKPDSPNYNKWLPVPIRCGLSFSYILK